MAEIKDPLQMIKDALNAPIEAVAPAPLDEAAIARSMLARYNKPTLKDELAKGEAIATK